MRFILLSVFFLTTVMAHAQWKASLGLNIPPVLAKSIELSSEFSRHPGYSLDFNLGHTFKTGHIGLIDYKVDDRIRERRTSGTFFKAGARLYPTSMSGKQKRNHFFVGAFLVLLHYEQTGLFEKLEVSDTYVPVSTKGTALFPAATIGFRHHLTRFLTLDWGVQKSFVIRKDDYMGNKHRNYQPGGGIASVGSIYRLFSGHPRLEISIC